MVNSNRCVCCSYIHSQEDCILTKKRFRLDLSRRIFIVSAVIYLLLTAMVINSLNLPSPDYSGVSELTLIVYQILSYILFFDLLFIGVLGGYHIALKVLEEEKEGRD